MRKLAGLFVFVAVLAGAIALTRYYSSPPAAVEPPPPPPAPRPAETRGAAAVTFKVREASLDFAAGSGSVTLVLETDPARPAPEKVWAWAYFFDSQAAGERRYCAGEPVELSKPFAPGQASATVSVTAKLTGCPAPSSPSASYHARINVSTESAFAARLSEGRISYDAAQATPATVRGLRPVRRS